MSVGSEELGLTPGSDKLPLQPQASPFTSASPYPERDAAEVLLSAFLSFFQG